MSSVVLTLKTCYMYIERCIDVLHVHHTMDNRRDCIPLLRLEGVTSDIRLSMSNGQLFSTDNHVLVRRKWFRLQVITVFNSL